MSAAKKLDSYGPVENQSHLRVVQDNDKAKPSLDSQPSIAGQVTENQKDDLHKPEAETINFYDHIDPEQVKKNQDTDAPENPEDEKAGNVIKLPSKKEFAAEKLIKIAQNFSEKVAGKYSTFEFIMSVIHAIVNGGRGGSLAYVGTTFGEFINNVYFAAGKKLPAFIGKPLVGFLSKLFNLKDKDGNLLTQATVGGKTEEGEENGEKISASLITMFARASGVYSVLKPLWQMMTGKKAQVQKITFANSFAQVWGPIANWWAMWSASAGKTMIGHSAFKLANKFKEGMGSLKTTGLEDLYCGLSSFTLAVDAVLSTISPKVSRIAEFASGIGISLLSMNNAAEGLNRTIWGKELPEQEDRTFPLLKMWSALGGTFGNIIYKTTEPIAKLLGGEIPKLSDIREIISKGLNKESEGRIIKLAEKYPDEETEVKAAA